MAEQDKNNMTALEHYQAGVANQLANIPPQGLSFHQEQAMHKVQAAIVLLEVEPKPVVKEASKGPRKV